MPADRRGLTRRKRSHPAKLRITTKVIFAAGGELGSTARDRMRQSINSARMPTALAISFNSDIGSSIMALSGSPQATPAHQGGGSPGARPAIVFPLDSAGQHPRSSAALSPRARVTAPPSAGPPRRARGYSEETSYRAVLGVGDPPWTRTMNPEIKRHLFYPFGDVRRRSLAFANFKTPRRIAA